MVAYGVWFLLAAPRVPAETTPLTDLVLLPVYWSLGVGNALMSIVPWRTSRANDLPGTRHNSMSIALVGALLLVALLVILQRRSELRPNVVVLAFAAGCGLYVLATGLTRISDGVSNAMLSRYTYVSTLFLLPLLVAVVSRALERRSHAARPQRCLLAWHWPTS